MATNHTESCGQERPFDEKDEKEVRMYAIKLLKLAIAKIDREIAIRKLKHWYWHTYPVSK